MLHPFASVVHRVFEGGPVSAPVYRVVPEPEIDSLLTIAAESSADLLILRYSAEDRQSRKMARYLLRRAPCSVWLLPSRKSAASLAEGAAFVDSPAISAVGWALRRDGLGSYLRANLSLLYVRRPSANRICLGQMWKDIFALSEPTFN
jgi:hypothetical protein